MKFRTRTLKTKVIFWLKSLRAYSFTCSLVPLLLGAAVAKEYAQEIKWIYFPFITLGGLSYHIGTNLINDYYDYLKGVDQKHTFGSSHILTNNLLSPKTIYISGILFFATGTLLGIPLYIEYGMPIILIVLTGLISGYFYSGGPEGYKYMALGDISIFIMMGPLMVIASYLGLTGTFSWKAALISLPIAFIATAILHGNNIRDLIHDKQQQIKTLPILLGSSISKKIFYGYLALTYLITAILVIYDILPYFSLLSFSTIPLALSISKYLRHNINSLKDLPEKTSLLHLFFGSMLIVSLLLPNPSSYF